ncbi:DUF4326 domain-containing protein [Streptosporangium sp. CA-115845]|uniref:DUF4326 domain-containing protein n=1 Tax=Streptosporangium sp. CA-115845 TaxID=3240071 RepID=UPI003D89B5E8
MSRHRLPPSDRADLTAAMRDIAAAGRAARTMLAVTDDAELSITVSQAPAPLTSQRPRALCHRPGRDGPLPPTAVWVGEGSQWETPFAVDRPVRRDSDLWPYIAGTVPGGAAGLASVTPLGAEQVAAAYLDWLIEQPALMITLIEELGGADLACDCPLPATGEHDHCHRSVLLAIAGDDEDI